MVQGCLRLDFSSTICTRQKCGTSRSLSLSFSLPDRSLVDSWRLFIWFIDEADCLARLALANCREKELRRESLGAPLTRRWKVGKNRRHTLEWNIHAHPLVGVSVITWSCTMARCFASQASSAQIARPWRLKCIFFFLTRDYFDEQLDFVSRSGRWPWTILPLKRSDQLMAHEKMYWGKQNSHNVMQL